MAYGGSPSDGSVCEKTLANMRHCGAEGAPSARAEFRARGSGSFQEEEEEEEVERGSLTGRCTSASRRLAQNHLLGCCAEGCG
mmetsp:Transcript_11086/g.29559  ORF Transcript_11086/g.29559 Transcript_11086/m.29559 type:complete len:83 (-) Transcript_11086:1467-1715(-)